MGKKNDFLSRMQAQYELAMQKQRRFCLQQSRDMMLIAAHDEFGFGQDRLRRLASAFDAVFLEYAQMVVDDAKGDKAIVYSKEKVDQRLKEICGDDFVAWEERYR